MIEHAIRHWFPGVVLGVEGLTDHVDVGLLTHLLRREQPKLQMASVDAHMVCLEVLLVAIEKIDSYIFLATSVSRNCSFMIVQRSEDGH